MKSVRWPSVGWPRWLAIALGAVLLVSAAAISVWTVRHAWAIWKLNRGVGDTVFYDALNRPWFRLDEQRRDVEFEQISTYFKDAVIAVEDHRFYYHPGIDPIGTSRALIHDITRRWRHAGRQHHHAAARADALPVEREDADAQGQGSGAGGDARGAPLQEGDPQRST